MSECPFCGSDKVREVFKITGQHEPLKLMRRCDECHHEREVAFTGNARRLFLPTDQTKKVRKRRRPGVPRR